MLAIHLCRFASVDESLAQRYMALLGEAERARFDALRRDDARRQFLICRALLRQTLARQIGCRPEMLCFERDPQDKPYLAEPVSPWRFNLSHSRDWAALVLSDDSEVGVDVECRSRRNTIDEIAERFYQPAEAAALRALPAAERRYRFFQLWTVKEAVVKALGRGIAVALAGTGVHCGEGGRLALTLRGGAAWNGSAAAWHFDLGDDYSLAAAQLTATPRPLPIPQLFESVPLAGSRPLALPADLVGTDTD